MSIPDSDTTHIRFVVNHDAPLKRGRLLFPDQRFREYEMRPGWERRKQLAGFAGHVHRDRPIRFSEGTVVEQKGAIYEMNCLLKVVERPGEPSPCKKNVFPKRTPVVFVRRAGLPHNRQRVFPNRSRKDGGRFLEGLKEAEASANGKDGSSAGR